MNERIRELKQQAADYVDSIDNGIGIEEYRELLDQKFAELIIKECMEVASPNYMSTPEDSAYYVELAIDRIADHFGVEE
jgi:hypothetical protein